MLFPRFFIVSGLYSHIIQLCRFYSSFNISASEALYEAYTFSRQLAKHLLSKYGTGKSAYMHNSYTIALVDEYIGCGKTVSAIIAGTGKEYHRTLLRRQLRFVSTIAVDKFRQFSSCIFHELSLGNSYLFRALLYPAHLLWCNDLHIYDLPF